ncbi:MAG: hypothetical protein ACRCVI_01720 [Mycoplasmoidaceae bacterium]
MKPIKILALFLMLFPIISIAGIILYVMSEKPTMLELIVCVLTIPFGLLAGIFLWLNAFGIIKL